MIPLVFAADAFGGRGGIAKYSRTFLECLVAATGVDYVVCLPRHILEPLGALPVGLDYRESAAKGRLAYSREVCRAIADTPYDVVVCGHVGLQLQLRIPVKPLTCSS